MLLITATAFGQRTYDCGNLNQRACGTGDWERVNMVAGENHKCETDLQESDGYCLNKDRNTLVVRNPFWTGWALENQMYGISANAPINFITWPAAHNAFSNETQGFSSPVYTNQRMSITDQLNAGVRHLELDPKYFMKFASTIINVGIPISDIAVRVCHASDVTLCLLPG